MDPLRLMRPLALEPEGLSAIATLAARWSALQEEESTLEEKRTDLQKQEDRLSIAGEDRKSHLLRLTEKAQAERRALKRERIETEQFVEALASNFSDVKKQVLAQKKINDIERTRLDRLQTHLKKRFRERWQAEYRTIRQTRKKLRALQAKLEKRELEISAGQDALQAKRLRFNADFLLGKNHLKESWAKLKLDQYRWKHRRGRERAALKVRLRDAETFAAQLQAVHKHVEEEKLAWSKQKTELLGELETINVRIANQRLLLETRQQQIIGLDQRRPISAAMTPAELALQAGLAWLHPQTSETSPEILAERQREQEQTARELADQRSYLADLWQRFQRLLIGLEAERGEYLRDIESLAHEILKSSEGAVQQQASIEEYEETLRQQHEEIVGEHHQVVGKQAQLVRQEADWEIEKRQLLTQVKARKKLVDQNIVALGQLKESCQANWQQEFDRLALDRKELAGLVEDLTNKRIELLQRLEALEQEKQRSAEERLALDAYLAEQSIGQDPLVIKRVEQLRRKWLLQNANILRTIGQDRNALREEIVTLQTRMHEMQRVLEEVQHAARTAAEQRFQLDYQATQAISHHARLQQEAETAQTLRQQSAETLQRLKEDFDTLSLALLSVPEALHVTRAA